MRTILVAVALLTSIPARAADLSTPRLWMAFGAWHGSFSQSDARGHELDIPGVGSLGLELGAGFAMGVFFLEYAVTWFIPNYIFNNPAGTAFHAPTHRDGVYYSLLGGNLGIRHPKIPFEPYVGVEKGNYGLSSGSKTDFSGLVSKLGLNLRINEFIGLRAEYRKHFISSDDSGSLPDDVSTRASYWFVGLVAGKL